MEGGTNPLLSKAGRCPGQARLHALSQCCQHRPQGSHPAAGPTGGCCRLLGIVALVPCPRSHLGSVLFHGLLASSRLCMPF